MRRARRRCHSTASTMAAQALDLRPSVLRTGVKLPSSRSTLSAGVPTRPSKLRKVTVYFRTLASWKGVGPQSSSSLGFMSYGVAPGSSYWGYGQITGGSCMGGSFLLGGEAPGSLEHQDVIDP